MRPCQWAGSGGDNRSPTVERRGAERSEAAAGDEVALDGELIVDGGVERRQSTGVRTLKRSGLKVAVVPTTDIGRFVAATAMWHIAMPVEEPPTASGTALFAS